MHCNSYYLVKLKDKLFLPTKHKVAIRYYSNCDQTEIDVFPSK